MHALILAGGELELSAQVKKLAKEAQFIVAADSGIRHAKSLGLQPDLIVGDFDSASEFDLKNFEGIPQKGFPPEKDWLDLELALAEVLKQNPDRISMMGATGGRLDQTLAALLIASNHAAQNIALYSGKQSIFYLVAKAELQLELAPSTLFSLLSLKEVSTVTVKNAQYELDDFALEFGVGLGVSNRVRQSPLSLGLKSGLIAIIIEHYE
ncbi:MAG: thiamine diphosphokinase [Trueperaceae bacterium]|nr:thiamine diphosphokinase [Trueperaceae bacterium]